MDDKTRKFELYQIPRDRCNIWLYAEGIGWFSWSQEEEHWYYKEHPTRELSADWMWYNEINLLEFLVATGKDFYATVQNVYELWPGYQWKWEMQKRNEAE